MWTMPERGDVMRRKLEKGRGPTSSRKIKLDIHIEWKRERGSTRPIEWSKTQEGFPESGRGN